MPSLPSPLAAAGGGRPSQPVAACVVRSANGACGCMQLLLRVYSSLVRPLASAAQRQGPAPLAPKHTRLAGEAGEAGWPSGSPALQTNGRRSLHGAQTMGPAAPARAAICRSSSAGLGLGCNPPWTMGHRGPVPSLGGAAEEDGNGCSCPPPAASCCTQQPKAPAHRHRHRRQHAHTYYKHCARQRWRNSLVCRTRARVCVAAWQEGGGLGARVLKRAVGGLQGFRARGFSEQQGGHPGLAPRCPGGWVWWNLQRSHTRSHRRCQVAAASMIGGRAPASA